MAITGSRKEQIAVITGGGDAPGLNAVIRGIVVRAISLGYDVLGFKKGWAGLIEGEQLFLAQVGQTLSKYQMALQR